MKVGEFIFPVHSSFILSVFAFSLSPSLFSGSFSCVLFFCFFIFFPSLFAVFLHASPFVFSLLFLSSIFFFFASAVPTRFRFSQQILLLRHFSLSPVSALSTPTSSPIVIPDENSYSSPFTTRRGHNRAF